MFEPENLAEMLENHEFRRGGVPLNPFSFSVDPGREIFLGDDVPLLGGDG